MATGSLTGSMYGKVKKNFVKFQSGHGVKITNEFD
jgi:hypothetical protein